MAEYLIQDTTLTAIADKIRPLLGLTGTMTPEQMQTNLTTEQANITAALAALAEKGVTVPDGANSNALAGLIAAIESGGGGMYFEKTTFSSYTESYTLNHNLGEKPNFCFFAILTDKASLPVRRVTAGIFVVLDGVMHYANIGTGNSGSGDKALARVAANTVEGVSELTPVSGMTLVVPTAVTESSLTLKGNSYNMPDGDYLFCCGQFALGGGS